MTMAKNMSADEKRWQIESDARTLTQYTEILSDTERYNAAKKKLEDQIKETEKALDAMKNYKQNGMI